MLPRRYPALLALLLLLAVPCVAAAQGASPGAEAALTPDGLRVTLACPAPAPPTLQVVLDGRAPVSIAPTAEPSSPIGLALVIERSAAMAEPGTPYSSRMADAVMLATALLEQIAPGSQVSLLSFDDDAVEELVAPTTDLAVVRSALAALPAGEAAAHPDGTAPATDMLLRADRLLDASPAGSRAIVVFAAGALAPEVLPALASSPRLTFVELSGAKAEAATLETSIAVGARELVRLPFHTDDSAALPALFAAFERRSAELLGSDRVALVVPAPGLGPGRHELLVNGCGAPQVVSFEAPAAVPMQAVWLAAALPALGLGYGLWRRYRRAASLRAGAEPATARYSSPLEVTTARRGAGPAERVELCAVVWDRGEQRVHSLLARQTTIGREAGCAIQIENEWVSGLHARLSLVGEGVEITDLESTNGTFVGEPGRPLMPGAPTPLALGELVRIGPDVRLTIVRAGAEQVEAPL